MRARRISEQMHRRVREAADGMGYRRQAVSAGMRTGLTFIRRVKVPQGLDTGPVVLLNVVAEQPTPLPVVLTDDVEGGRCSPHLDLRTRPPSFDM